MLFIPLVPISIFFLYSHSQPTFVRIKKKKKELGHELFPKETTTPSRKKEQEKTLDIHQAKHISTLAKKEEEKVH